MSHLPPEIDWGNPNPTPQPVIAPTGVGAARPVWLCITSPEYTPFVPLEGSHERNMTQERYDEYLRKKELRREASAHRITKKERERAVAREERKKQVEIEKQMRAERAAANKLLGYEKKKTRKMKDPAPAGYTMIRNLSEVMSHTALMAAVKKGAIPSVIVNNITYIDEMAARRYVATKDERRKTVAIHNRQKYLAERVEEIPEGYAKVYTIKCGLSYRAILNASKAGKIPSALCHGALCVDINAATEYANRHKK